VKVSCWPATAFADFGADLVAAFVFLVLDVPRTPP
jgi:hypothetical protein